MARGFGCRTASLRSVVYDRLTVVEERLYLEVDRLLAVGALLHFDSHRMVRRLMGRVEGRGRRGGLWSEVRSRHRRSPPSL